MMPHSEYKNSEHKLGTGIPQSHRAASPGGLVGRHDGGYGGYGGVGENTEGSGYSEDGGRGGYHGGLWHHGGGPGHQGGPGHHGGSSQHGHRSLLQKPQGSALSQLQGRVRRLQGGPAEESNNHMVSPSVNKTNTNKTVS